MGILRVLFIAEIITDMTDEGISSTVNHFQLINNLEIELWEELISADLTAVEFTDGDEVFQILIISKHSHRISSAMSFRVLLFKCFNNDQ